MWTNTIATVSYTIGNDVGIGLVLLLSLGVLLLPAIISGCLTKKLAAKKGYHGYFWTGFFLMFLGLLYVGFLPVASVSQHERELENT